jgi:hypothetical protein
MAQVNFDVIDEGVRAWLQIAAAKNVGLAKLPPVTPGAGYCILYPMPTGRGEGSYFDPEEDREFLYQVTSVGVDARQARALSSRVCYAFIGRTASGDYAHPINILGVNVQWRRSDMLGSILPSGVDLFQVSDTYRLRIGA